MELRIRNDLATDRRDPGQHSFVSRSGSNSYAPVSICFDRGSSLFFVPISRGLD